MSTDDDNDGEMSVDEDVDNMEGVVLTYSLLISIRVLGEEDFEVPDDSVLKLSGHTKDVFCLAISPQGNKLLSGSEDDKAIVWNIENFKNTGLITFLCLMFELLQAKLRTE